MVVDGHEGTTDDLVDEELLNREEEPLTLESRPSLTMAQSIDGDKEDLNDRGDEIDLNIL